MLCSISGVQEIYVAHKKAKCGRNLCSASQPVYPYPAYPLCVCISFVRGSELIVSFTEVWNGLTIT
jgi:hypothetical protein